MDKTVFIPILTRNHNNYLKHYLRCIEELDYPKDKIVIYINTNNNDDDTVATLMNWVTRVHKTYKKVIFEHNDFDGLYRDMGWQDKNQIRLYIMSTIRQRSLDLCKQEKCDYFFPMDTDNWVEPCTLKYLINKGLPLIAPFLKDYAERNVYSNYFYTLNEWGFIGKDVNDESFKIWHRRDMNGTFEVPLIHCTYLLDCNHINNVHYYDGSSQWEFITFAASARNGGVKQYICNERMFGFVRYDTVVDEPECYKLITEKCERDNSIVDDSRIPIGIYTASHEKYKKRREVVEKTWLKEIDRSRFRPIWVMSDSQKTEGKDYLYNKAENILYLNGPDTYEGLTEKSRAFNKWFMEQTTASHYWKCDDDTYINATAFNKYDLFLQHDYTGLMLNLPPTEEGGSYRHFMSGAGYSASRRVASVIAEKLVNNGPEDHDIGLILQLEHPEFSWYNEKSIDPFSGCKKIDGLMIGHWVQAEDMETMHSFYKEPA